LLPDRMSAQWNSVKKRKPQDRSRCPSCKERVTPFAAGCSWCGADLDVRRWDTGPSLGQRLGSWLRAITSGPNLVRGGRGPSTFLEYVVNYALLSLCISAIGAIAYALIAVIGG
jgi:hypothetical protein